MFLLAPSNNKKKKKKFQRNIITKPPGFFSFEGKEKNRKQKSRITVLIIFDNAKEGRIVSSKTGMVIIILTAEKLWPRNAISGRVIERISGICGRLIIENLTVDGSGEIKSRGGEFLERVQRSSLIAPILITLGGGYSEQGTLETFSTLVLKCHPLPRHPLLYSHQGHRNYNANTKNFPFSLLLPFFPSQILFRKVNNF